MYGFGLLHPRIVIFLAVIPRNEAHFQVRRELITDDLRCESKTFSLDVLLIENFSALGDDRFYRMSGRAFSVEEAKKRLRAADHFFVFLGHDLLFHRDDASNYPWTIV